MNINKNINSVQDYEEVIAAMKIYTDGLRSGDTELLRSVFHKDAVMHGFWGEHLIEGSIENLYSSVKQAGAAPQIVSHITILHKTPTTASVRNEVEANAVMEDFTEYHSLIKVNGEWKIVAKLFHKYDK